MDDRPGIGIGVEVADLARGECVFEDVVFDASVGQGPGRVDAHRLQFACDQFHGRNAALADAGDKGAAVREGRPFAPQAESHGIGQIVDVGGTSGRGVNHACARQTVLQFDAHNALLRTLRGAEPPFTTGNAAHGMGLVEHDQTVKFRRQPFEQLLKAGLVAGAAAQRRIGGEQDAVSMTDLRFGLDFREGLNVEYHTAQRLPITAGILDQRIALADPKVAAAASQPLIHQDRGKLAALAGASPVAEEEPAPIGSAVRVRHQFKAARGHAIATGQIGGRCLKRVDQCFQLGAAQHSVADNLGR